MITEREREDALAKSITRSIRMAGAALVLFSIVAGVLLYAIKEMLS